MVRGLGIAVTAVAPKYQWAEMARIALGRGNLRPKARQASVKPLRSSVFIGLPWPMKRAGILAMFASRFPLLEGRRPNPGPVTPPRPAPILRAGRIAGGEARTARHR